MNQIRAASGVLLATLILCAPSAFARDKTSPDALRSHNAGVSTFVSERSLPYLFNNIAKVAEDCYSMTTGPGLGLGGGIAAAAGPLTDASRIVVAEMDPDHLHAYVIVRAVSGMAWMKDNLIQFDMTAITPDQTKLDVYRSRRNAFYQNAVVNGEAWSKGQFDVCKMDWYSKKRHDQKVRAGR